MKKAIRILALGVAVAASATIAKADIIGEVSTAGQDSYNTNTISFDTSYKASGASGIFAPLNGGSVVFNGALNYTYGSYPAYLVYTITEGTDTLNFYATSNDYSYGGGAPGAGTYSLTINGSGYYTSNFFTGDVPGSFTITSQGEPSQNAASVTFSASGFAFGTSPVPEPSSLILLGSSLLGAAALARRRFSHKMTA